METEWELTDQERQDLKARQLRRVGRQKLIATITDMMGLEVEAEMDWWEALYKRLGIKADLRNKLIASCELGKVWLSSHPPLKQEGVKILEIVQKINKSSRG